MPTMQSLLNRLVAPHVKQFGQADARKIHRVLLSLSFLVAQLLPGRAAAPSKIEKQ